MDPAFSACSYIPFSDFVLDPAKCNQLSMEDRRLLVREIAQLSKDAPKILSSLTRRELLEIICAEMGEERKYTGLSKPKMIEHLLKLVSKKSKETTDDSLALHPSNTVTGFKRQRKEEQLLEVSVRPDHAPWKNKRETVKLLLCQNLACRATMSPEDNFCKRCSCCICHQYDDNKDPSLWICCESDHPDEWESCGMSCHLKCALKHERAGISMEGCCAKLDGSFFCVSCGKVNGLMRTWRKQLLAAMGARRVDALCLRVLLSHKILEGTEKYEVLLKFVESCVKTLENEVGNLDLASTEMDRLIVNRLSCCTEVQQLCTSAVEAFDSMPSDRCSNYMDKKDHRTCHIHFQKSSSTTANIILEYEDHLFEEFLGCRLWHRKSTAKGYPKEATCIVLRPERRFKLIDLDPSTEYVCKVSFFSKRRTLDVLEAKWVTPMFGGSSISVSDEELGEKEDAVSTKAQELGENPSELLPKKVGHMHDALAVAGSGENWFTHPYPHYIGEAVSATLNCDMIKQPSLPPVKENSLTSPSSTPPPTPCKSDGMTKVSCLGGKKQLKESAYEYSVRVIRRLEHEGHLSADFRVKFLTWFSLKATVQERRVVNVFIDTMINDPQCLAGQLIDSFMEKICSEQNMDCRHGLCTKLWH
ncbi:hypothetical protein RJ640_022590 [Escallonia rubra]|uniref:Uncharacterized protein n=1 Tax=Escallonia rubra TaxID=112253 RepID=A0AA88R647_9ASTE|nr:hypothetical protein RJ640_022590 [Escallonia rubra]